MSKKKIVGINLRLIEIENGNETATIYLFQFQALNLYIRMSDTYFE